MSRPPAPLFLQREMGAAGLRRDPLGWEKIVSRLWIYHDSPQWLPVPLDETPLGLLATGLFAAVEDAPVILTPHIDDAGIAWALIARGGEADIVRVNGDRLPLGIRGLHHRDAIQIGAGERIYFSTESPPDVRPFPQGRPDVPCARCSTDIHPADLAVKCPKCGVYMHQSEEFPCWLYSDTCVCGRSTAMDDENCWRPDEI